MMRIVRRGIDRLSIYLPLVLMGVLALGTYWLVRSTPLLETAPSEQPVRVDPDYRMERFSIKTFDSKGRLKNVFSAVDICRVHCRRVACPEAVVGSSVEKRVATVESFRQ